MSATERHGGPPPGPDAHVLEQVAEDAAADAGAPRHLLGAYVPDAVSHLLAGRRLPAAALADCERLGALAAEDGVDLPTVLDLYLTATWRLWDVLGDAVSPTAGHLRTAAAALLRTSDDAAEALGRGYQAAQRGAIRREEAVRREFIDDVLAGHLSGEVFEEHARRIGFNLAGVHHVVVARSAERLRDAGPVQAHVEAMLLTDVAGDAFVATKDGRLVCALPGDGRDGGALDAPAVLRTLSVVERGPWQLGVGGAYLGPSGVAQSHREAVEALTLLAQLRLDTRIVHFAELAPFRLLAQDRHLLALTVDTVLGPLAQARGGPEALIDTLAAYFDEGLSATATARRLHLSVRAVTYRLERVAQLTGRSLRDPLDRFVLELAVRSRLLLPD